MRNPEECIPQLKAAAKVLADIILEYDVSKDDVHSLSINEFEFQLNCAIAGETLDYFEWREHPIHGPNVECSTNGQFRFDGVEIPLSYDKRTGKLAFIVHRSKGYARSYEAAGTILSCFVPMPTSGVHKVGFRNHRTDDLRISNLYWYKMVK